MSDFLPWLFVIVAALAGSALAIGPSGRAFHDRLAGTAVLG